MSSMRSQIKVSRIGVNYKLLNNIYFLVLKMPWRYFIICFILTFVIINTFFALFYWLSPGSISNLTENSFWDAFVFSCQTFSTVGYGVYHPVTTYGHIIVIIENVSGILFTAIMTGLTFSKFSKPTSTVIFSKVALISIYDGVPTLMFRIGNGRDTSIVDAKVSVVTLRSQTTVEGYSMQRFVDLKLERNTSPFFFLSWTVMHRIDEESPFYKFSQEDIVKNKVRIFVTLNGYDETLSEMVHNGWIYQTDQIVFGKKFEDVIEASSDGTSVLNFNKFHSYEK